MLRGEATIQGLQGGEYVQVYVPARVSSDSSFPFGPGDDVGLEVVDGVLVVTPGDVEIEDAEIELKENGRDPHV